MDPLGKGFREYVVGSILQRHLQEKATTAVEGSIQNEA